MTTTTLTFLVILLSITTSAFFILSFIVIKRNNKQDKTINYTTAELQRACLNQQSSLKIIENQDNKIAEITRTNEKIQKR